VTISSIASLCEIGAASVTSTLSSFISRRLFVLDSIGFDYARSKFILTCLTGKSVQRERRIIQFRFKRRVFCMYLNVFFQSPHNTVRVCGMPMAKERKQVCGGERLAFSKVDWCAVGQIVSDKVN
jgi:hypothetical protein